MFKDMNSVRPNTFEFQQRNNFPHSDCRYLKGPKSGILLNFQEQQWELWADGELEAKKPFSEVRGMADLEKLGDE